MSYGRNRHMIAKTIIFQLKINKKIMAWSAKKSTDILLFQKKN